MKKDNALGWPNGRVESAEQGEQRDFVVGFEGDSEVPVVGDSAYRHCCKSQEGGRDRLKISAED